MRRYVWVALCGSCHCNILGPLHHRQSTLLRIRRQLDSKAKEIRNYTQPLFFKNPPVDNEDEDVPIHEDLPMIPNEGAYPLQEGLTQNAAFLDYEKWLISAFYEAQTIVLQSMSVLGEGDLAMLPQIIQGEMHELQRRKGMEWERQRMTKATGRIVRGAGISVVEIGEYQPVSI